MMTETVEQKYSRGFEHGAKLAQDPAFANMTAAVERNLARDLTPERRAFLEGMRDGMTPPAQEEETVTTPRYLVHCYGISGGYIGECTGAETEEAALEQARETLSRSRFSAFVRVFDSTQDDGKGNMLRIAEIHNTPEPEEEIDGTECASCGQPRIVPSGPLCDDCQPGGITAHLHDRITAQTFATCPDQAAQEWDRLNAIAGADTFLNLPAETRDAIRSTMRILETIIRSHGHTFDTHCEPMYPDAVRSFSDLDIEHRNANTGRVYTPEDLASIARAHTEANTAR